jgi:protein-disulfide isomerase
MSTNEPRQTKAEKQAAARAAREAQTTNDAAAAQRKKRLWQLGAVGVIAIAAIIVVVAIAGGGSGSSSGTPSGTPNGIADVTSALDGVPQAGLVAGKPSAPYTFVEYGDLKCPACREFDVNALPTILKDYVKTGKIKFEFRTLHFLDQQTPGTNDSENAAKYAHAAGLQKKGISFVELWYFNQKPESDVYATPEYLNWLGAAIPGFDTAKATADAKSKLWDKVLKKDADSAATFGFNSTPSFLFGPTGGELAPMNPAGDISKASSFTAIFDQALGK